MSITSTMMTILTIIIIFLFHDVVFSQPLPITKPITSSCVGGNHGCLVFDTKKMKCWGLGGAFGSSIGDVGDQPSELGDFMPFINVGSNVGIEKVSCGGQYTCVKLDTGDMKCLGSNGNGQTGLGTTTNPIGASNGYVGDNLPVVNVGSGLKVLDIALAAAHSCVLLTGNKVKCYGDNRFGQLGYGDTASTGYLSSHMGDNLPFVDFGIGVEVASVHSGPIAYHSCVILSKPTNATQRIKCWGLNSDYILGYGDYNNRGDSRYEMGDNLTLVDLGTESRVKQLAIQYSHTCALLINGIVKCFGNGVNGQLASGSTATVSTTGNSLPSVLIDSGKTINYITGGQYHTCIVYDDMITMKCVGKNDYGQLGQGDTLQRGETPATLFPNITAIDLGKGSVKISSIQGGNTRNCVFFEDYTIKCFGWNLYGALGIGSTSTKGNGPNQMGTNLPYVWYISPTKSPTQSPTKKPTSAPTIPTKSPSRDPTFRPTKSPTTLNPTQSPTTRPTSSPTLPCSYANSKKCNNDFKCTWEKVNGIKQCIVLDCTTLEKSDCKDQNKKCKWNKNTSSCDPKTK